MGAENICGEYKIIVRFFKEIGLYKEFKEYCHWSITCYVGGYYNFKTWETNPLKNFGGTQITYWLKDKKGIKLKNNFNLYDYFKAWIFTFYPNYYSDCGQPYEDALKTIDKEKRTIKIEFIKNKKDE